MNLRDWFQEQQKTQPTELQKMRIYQSFLDKSHKSFKFHTFRRYIKIGVFSFIFLTIGGVSYFSLENDNDYLTIFEGNNYSIIKPQSGKVLANTLGTIIKTTGKIHIINTNDNTTIETTDLHDNERVILSENAEIEFTVRDNIHAKIVGPASFELQDLGTQKDVNNYAINLISGDYFEIISIEKEEIAIKRDTKSNKKTEDNEKKEESKIPKNETQYKKLKKKKKEHIIIKSSTFSIESKKITGNINVVIRTTEDGKQELKNKGDEIVMKTIIEDEQKYIAIAPQQKVAVNGHIEFKKIDIEKLKQEIKNKKLAVRYQVKTQKENIISTEKTKSITIADTLETTIIPQKKAISPEILSTFDKAINPSFLNNNIAQMKKYSLAGNDASFNIAFNNLMLRVYKGYNALGMSIPHISPNKENLSAGINIINTLITKAKNIYYIDPSHLGSLYTAENELRILSHSFLTQKTPNKTILPEKKKTKTIPTKKKEKTKITSTAKKEENSTKTVLPEEKREKIKIIPLKKKEEISIKDALKEFDIEYK